MEPLQVTFHGVPHSDAIETHVRTCASKLQTFFDRMTSCRVVIEAPHKHKHSGRPYRIRIDLGVPQDEIVVSRDVGGDASEDVHAAIDEAFDEVGRRLQDHVKLHRPRQKHHEHARHGTVAKLSIFEGYGFIQTEEGDEIYFHRNAVMHGAFDRMKHGDRVRFTEVTGEDGVHASTVVLLGR
jgi:ribosomal subunit interface protein